MKRYNRLSLIGMVALAMFAACSPTKKSETVVEEEKPAVKLLQVSKQMVPQTSELTATVEANVVNNITPNMPLRIGKILVEVGDPVRAGQTLVLMDQSSLDQNKMQLDNMDLEFNRLNELYKVGGATKSAIDAQKTQLAVAKKAYNLLMENTKLVSPISGIVTARNYDNGDMFGQQAVLTIQDITPVKLLLNVSESYYTYVKKGMDVTVKADVYGDETFEGHISLVYPTIDPLTRTFPVEVEVANSDQRLRPGMFSRTTIDFGSVERVVVPDLAVIKQQGAGERYVYVYNNGKVSLEKVEIGRQLGSTYEVISGLEDGDQVVVSGQTRLKNGIEVAMDTNQY